MTTNNLKLYVFEDSTFCWKAAVIAESEEKARDALQEADTYKERRPYPVTVMSLEAGYKFDAGGNG